MSRRQPKTLMSKSRVHGIGPADVGSVRRRISTHNPKVSGSNPAPATTEVAKIKGAESLGPFGVSDTTMKLFDLSACVVARGCPENPRQSRGEDDAAPRQGVPSSFIVSWPQAKIAGLYVVAARALGCSTIGLATQAWGVGSRWLTATLELGSVWRRHGAGHYRRVFGPHPPRHGRGDRSGGPALFERQRLEFRLGSRVAGARIEGGNCVIECEDVQPLHGVVSWSPWYAGR
jgi:hypothetical protein